MDKAFHDAMTAGYALTEPGLIIGSPMLGTELANAARVQVALSMLNRHGLIAGATGISGKLILEWVNHADLMRIDGVGSEYSDLLEAAGVDSPSELAQRNAANLATTFQEVVAARPDIVRRVPSETEIAGWIAESKTLAKVVEH